MFNGGALKQGLASIPAEVPKLFITGTKDNYTSQANFQKFVDELTTDNKTVVFVPNANHFWGEQETELVAHINQWMGRLGLNAKTRQAASAGALRISPGINTSAGARESVKEAARSPITPASMWSEASEE